jgi:hypothetical protein
MLPKKPPETPADSDAFEAALKIAFLSSFSATAMARDIVLGRRAAWR